MFQKPAATAKQGQKLKQNATSSIAKLSKKSNDQEPTPKQAEVSKSDVVIKDITIRQLDIVVMKDTNDDIKQSEK